MERKDRRLFLELQEPICGGGLSEEELKALLDNLLKLLPQDVRYHPITKGTYRMWNLVSNGLIQPINGNSSVVTCSGQFGDPNSKK